MMLVKCSNCGRMLDAQADRKTGVPCPNCGCCQRTIEADVVNELGIRYQMKAKVRDPNLTGKKKHRLEITAGDDLHRKSGRWHNLDRRIDRKSDRYTETVTDPETGQVIHHCDEPLSKHRGHGSDKQNGGEDEEE